MKRRKGQNSAKQWSEMTPINRTLEGKNRTLGGDGGSKIVKNRRTSLMDDP